MPEERKNNSHNLLEVSKQAGKLRVALFVVIFFIMWSLFAIISANVFPSNPLFFNYFESQKGSLAHSIFFEMLSYYFSIFTISSLILIIISLCSGFFLIKSIIQTLSDDIDPAPIRNYLLQCAFSIPKFPKYNISNVQFQGSDEYKRLKELGGPAYISYEPEIILIISKAGNQIGPVITKNGKSYSDYFLSHGEKIYAMFDNKRHEFIDNIKIFTFDNRELFFKNMRFCYSFSEKEIKNLISVSNYEKTIHLNNFIGFEAWKQIIHHLFIEEFRRFMNGLSLGEINDFLKNIGLKYLQNVGMDNKEILSKSPQISSHLKQYAFLVKKFSLNQYPLKRNRRFSSYPLLHQSGSNSIAIDNSSKQLGKFDITKNTIQKEVNKRMGFEVIKILSLDVKEVIING